MKCKFCKKEISENTKTCPYCEKKTSKRKVSGFYWGILGLVAITMWIFFFGGRAFVANLLYSDGFTVDSNFERNVVSLSEMAIEINPNFDPTFVNRMNYYHQLLIGVFDGEIYSQLTGGEVRSIDSNNLETYEIIHPTTGGMSFSQIHIEDNVLYYTPPHGDFERRDFGGQTNQHETIAYGVYNSINSFAKFDNFVLHRTHGWDFARHHPNARVDGSIYMFDLESETSEVLLEDSIREFFADKQNDRILFAVRSNIFEVNFAGEDRNLITGDFLHYSRIDPHFEHGWMYDGNHVFWINSGDWTGIESSIFSFNLETREEEYLGRISNAAGINVVGDDILVSTTDGHLYLINVDAMHRRLLSDDVGSFAVVGDHIFYQQIGTRNIYLMDINGNVAFFTTIEPSWHTAPDVDEEYEM